MVESSLFCLSGPVYVSPNGARVALGNDADQCNLFTVDKTYYNASYKVIEEQIVKAGRRLAVLIDALAQVRK